MRQIIWTRLFILSIEKVDGLKKIFFEKVDLNKTLKIQILKLFAILLTEK